MTPARRFKFRLALALHHPNPDAMLALMPYRTYQDWMTYSELEPFGEERADLRTGIITATIANCLARRKGRPAFRATDFMPKFDRPFRRKRTPDDMLKQVKLLNMLYGGEFIDKRKVTD
jgi:hypothetical protein